MSGWAALAGIGGQLIDSEISRKDASRNRAHQVTYGQNQLSWKIKDAARHGIHPLAAIGAPTTASSGTSRPSTNFSGALSKAGQYLDNRQAKKLQLRLLTAEADKAESEAKIQRDIANNGGNPTDYHTGGTDQRGQPDTNIYSSAEGVERDIPKAQRYTIDREGNFYLIPSQSVEQAFSDEGTIQNRFLYQMRDANFPNKVRQLKKNWSSPKFKEFKWRFMQTRPKPRSSNRVVLWNGINWQSFRKTSQNKDRIFTTGHRTYQPRKKKIMRSHDYDDSPMS